VTTAPPTARTWPGPLPALLGASLLGFIACAAASALGSFIVFRETWLGMGVPQALGSYLTSAWFVSGALDFVLFPAAIVALERRVRRSWLRALLLVPLGAALALTVQLAVAGVPGTAALTSLLSLLLVFAGASLAPRIGLGLLLPASYLLFVLNGLLPARGLLGGSFWALGLDAPLNTLAQVGLIEAPRLIVLVLLVRRWRRSIDPHGAGALLDGRPIDLG